MTYQIRLDRREFGNHGRAGGMEREIDGWMDGWIEIDRQEDRDRQADGRTDGWIDRHKKTDTDIRQTSRQKPRLGTYVGKRRK